MTGASSGIGRAIAVALSRLGVQLCVLGRDEKTLGETVAATQQFSRVAAFQTDLTAEGSLEPLLHHLEKETGRLDILIHSAGVARLDVLEHAGIEDLDLQYATNVRAPYVMTQRLLPLLKVAGGQIVFLNSTVGLTAKRPEVGQYAATKHALKAIADSLREEVNSMGIRVLTAYLGRTATSMQETLFRQEGRAYRPEMLLQPADVAAMLVQILLLPPSAEVTDITIRPMLKSY